MKILGLNKTTLLDYPGRVAATIFIGDCNFRCPFCHNGDLVLSADLLPRISKEDVLSFLEKRKGILSGVCISGGEPTLSHDLAPFMMQIRTLGYFIKLDTNGSRPDVLASLIRERLIDYAAMDIKADRAHYPLACGVCPDLSKIEESVELLKRGTLDHEFRTTVVKGIHTPDMFTEIGKWLKGDSSYYLQSYRESRSVIQKQYAPFPKEELEHILSLVKPFLPNSSLRGID